MSRALRVLLVALLVVPVTLCAGGPAAGAVPDGSTPDWDPRIAPIAKSVEKIRGLRFDHPVPVRFLSDKAFRKEVTADEADLTKRDKREIRRATESLRALGLISGDVDLFEAVNAKQGSDVLAFYDPDEKEVVVRGKGPIDVATKVTLAHELTHVLQDQEFDLNEIEHGFDETTTASDAFDALVEGDATWVENTYVDRLPESDQDTYSREDDAAGERADAAAVPKIVDVLFGAPYVLGPDLVDILRLDGGVTALNGAFRNPPTADAQVLDPVKLLLQTTTKDVAAPKPGKGEKKVGAADEFGALGLYLVLASRLPAAEAYAAASRWAGDREITVRDGDTTCVRAAFRGRTAAATDVLTTGLVAWAATLPAGIATVTPKAKAVELRSCDPGLDSPPLDDARLDEALTVLVERNGALAEALRGDAPTGVAACFADGLVAEPAFTELVGQEVRGEEIDADTEARLTAGAQAVAGRCRATG
jgi:hypothetical protein